MSPVCRSFDQQFPHILDLPVSQTQLLVFEQQFLHNLDLPFSQTHILVFEQQYSHKAEFDWSPRFRLKGQANAETLVN